MESAKWDKVVYVIWVCVGVAAHTNKCCTCVAEEKFLHKLPRTCFKVFAPNPKNHLNLIFVVKPEEGRWKNTQFFIEASFPSTAPQDYPMHPPECKLREGFKVMVYCIFCYLTLSKTSIMTKSSMLQPNAVLAFSKMSRAIQTLAVFMAFFLCKCTIQYKNEHGISNTRCIHGNFLCRCTIPILISKGTFATVLEKLGSLNMI